MIIDWEVPRYVPCDADDDDAPDIWSHPDIHLPAVQDSPRSVTKGLLRPTATNSNPVEETEILGRSQFGDHPHSPTFCSQSVCVDIFAMLNFCDKILYLILKHSWGQSHTFCSQPHNWRNCDHFLSSKLLKFNGRVRYSNSITDVFHTLFKRPLTLTPPPPPPPQVNFSAEKNTLCKICNNFYTCIKEVFNNKTGKKQSGRPLWGGQFLLLNTSLFNNVYKTYALVNEGFQEVRLPLNF